MRILVLGQTGMLGHVVYTYLKEHGHDVWGTGTKDGDFIYDAFGSQESIEGIVEEIKPDAVINCIGVLNKVAEDNKLLAVKLNSLLPHYLDRLSQKYHFKFVHVSTDCVYEGTLGDYREKDLPDATSFYGRSKALGEVNNDNSVTLRTSIVGPDNNPRGIGLFQWFITSNEDVQGYSKVIWTGVTTIELARVILIAIENNVCGLNHVVNNSTIAKHDLLELFKKYFQKDIEITASDQVESKKTLVRTDESYDFGIPSYEQMIADMKVWVENHAEMYPLIMDNCGLRRVKK